MRSLGACNTVWVITVIKNGKHLTFKVVVGPEDAYDDVRRALKHQ
jgi:hypothetical protein